MGNHRALVARTRCRSARPAPGGRSLNAPRRLAPLIAALLVFASPTSRALPPAERIASLNLCTDTLLFELVDDERIASVTRLSRDANLGYHHRRAARLPVNHGAIEELIALDPDLVITGDNTTAFAEQLLERLGLAVMRFPHADSFESFSANLERLATRIGARERATVLLDRMWRELDALALENAGRPRARALVLQPNGYMPGSTTFMHEVLSRGGLDNVATELGVRFGGFLTLEQVIVSAPEILVLGLRQGDARALGEALLEHPVLATAQRHGVGLERRTVDENLWTCAGTFSVRAVAQLRHRPR